MKQFALGMLLMMLILLNIVLHYVVVPFILMKVLAFFGITISLWLCIGIIFVLHVLIGLLKR